MVLVLPPILLITYPSKVFRKCLARTRLNNWQPLHMFVENFQGDYKDGTQGTYDYRFLSGMYLVFRIVLVIPLQSSNDLSSHLYIMSTLVLLFFISLFFALVRPYKKKYINFVASSHHKTHIFRILLVSTSPIQQQLEYSVFYTRRTSVVILFCSSFLCTGAAIQENVHEYSLFTISWLINSCYIEFVASPHHKIHRLICILAVIPILCVHSSFAVCTGAPEHGSGRRNGSPYILRRFSTREQRSEEDSEIPTDQYAESQALDFVDVQREQWWVP